MKISEVLIQHVLRLYRKLRKKESLRNAQQKPFIKTDRNRKLLYFNSINHEKQYSIK